MDVFPQQVYLVNGVLSQYIAIHNEIFNFSWRKVLPIPGIFKSIEYPRHRDALELLAAQLGDVLDAPGDECLPPVFGHYVAALRRTLTALQGICSRVADKAEGEGYPMTEYNADMASYKALCNQYLELGAALNRQIGLTH